MSFYKQGGMSMGGMKIVRTGPGQRCACGSPDGNCTSKNMKEPRVALSDKAPEDKQIYRVTEDIVEEREITPARRDEEGKEIPATTVRIVHARKGDYVSRPRAVELGLIQPD